LTNPLIGLIGASLGLIGASLGLIGTSLGLCPLAVEYRVVPDLLSCRGIEERDSITASLRIRPHSQP